MNKTLGKIALGVAGVLVMGGVVGTLSAQEEPERERERVRIVATGQGSYLGVYIRDVDEEIVSRLGLPGERGVLVTGVADDGPAAKAGVQEDDVILGWNGQSVESQTQLRRLLRETPPGRTVSLDVFRDRSEQAVSVELGKGGGLARAFEMRSGWDDESAERLRDELRERGRHLEDLGRHLRVVPEARTFLFMGGGRLGVGIQSLGDQLGEYFGLGERTGVLVTSVEEESAAAKAGLKAGDVILAIDGQEVENPGDVVRRVRQAEAGPTAVRILRDKKERTITVDLPESGRRAPGWTEGEVQGLFLAPDDLPEIELDLQFPDLDVLREGLREGPVRWRPSAPPAEPGGRVAI